MQSSGGGTIAFTCTPADRIFGAEVVITGTMVISMPVTINGGGFVTLKAGAPVRLFEVDTDQRLTLSNITLANFKADTDNGGTILLGPSSALTMTNTRILSSSAQNGGAIYAAASPDPSRTHIALTNVVISGTSATVYGGALDVQNNVLQIVSSTLMAGSADVSGGAIFGGLNYGSLKIAASNVTSNTAGDGGAIAWDEGDATIADSAFHLNVATRAVTGDGGAIRADGPVTISTSSFTSNTAQGSGGALHLRGGKYAIERTRITNNEAGKDGGGIKLASLLVGRPFELPSIDIDTSTISSNTALGGNGGGLDVSDYSAWATVTSSHFDHNQANADKGAGGGMYTVSRAEIVSSTFNFNSAGAGGGLGFGADLSVARTLGAPQRAGEGPASNKVWTSEIRGNRAALQGGGVFDEGSRPGVALLGSVIAENSAGFSGGGIYTVRSSWFEFSSIISNTAGSEGGGITGLDVGPAVTNSTISGNSAIQGGGVFLRSQLPAALERTASFAHVTLVNNLAQTGASAVVTGTLQARFVNSILAMAGSGTNCEGPTGNIVSLGNNLLQGTGCGGFFFQPGDVSTNSVGLGPLANNGGSTAGFGVPLLTHMPAAGSPAVDTAFCMTNVLVDQREVARPQDGDGNGSAICDKGAVERVYVAAPANKRVFLPAIGR